MKRNNFTKDEAQKRISAQESEEKKISKSDYVLYNNGDVEFLKKEVDKLLLVHF